jgi:uncharacterized repeat protein (TIGR01451 family)
MDSKSNRAAPAKLLLGIGLVVAGQASAAEYWLCAKAGTVDMPGDPGVPIWGYVLDDDGDLANGCSATPALPGPALEVPVGDATLTVHLRNDLTSEPTSIVVPGQAAQMTPVWTDGSSGPRTSATQRVRSFTHEAPPNGGTADYVWNGLRPGTFVYHSGTHPQVQVQMGLYGAVKKSFAAGQTYEGVPHAAEVTLLFSEIDPAQHRAIAGVGGTFGPGSTTPTACPDTDGSAMPMTSTLCYKPKYFLLNGNPFEPGAPPLATLAPGQATLLRLLNAGYRGYAPLIQGTHMKMIAENGNRYQYRVGATVSPRDQFQYSTWLAPLSTVDAILAPTAPGSYPIYDRRLHTVNAATQDGGLFGILQVANTTPGTGADLAVTKTDGVNSVPQGGSVTYTIVVTNHGPDPVIGATVSDALPAALTLTDWTCAPSAGSACTADGAAPTGTVDLPSGGSATFTATATVAATATGTLVNTASVSPPAGVADGNPANDSARDVDAIEPAPIADLGVTLSNGVTGVVAGTAVQYTIVVSNAGPAPVTGAVVSNQMPAQLTAYSWSCTATTGSVCPVTGGNGSIEIPVNLLPGGAATFTVNATVAAGATGDLVNTATVIAMILDGNPANDTATDTDAIAPPRANLGVTVTDGLTSVNAGGALTYTIAVSNAGPSSVTGALVNDSFPAALTGVSWTCSAAPGSLCPAPTGVGNIVDGAVTLPSGGAVTFLVRATVSPTATGTLVNTATVAHASDPTPGNDTATDTTAVAPPSANLGITKTDNRTQILPGDALIYTIVVNNAGPSLAAGATVVDNLPAALTGVTWNCVATAGSSCALPLGSGNVNTTVNLAVGGSATFTVNATVGAGAFGSLVNTATVTLAYDPVTANNTATDTDQLPPPPLPSVPVLDTFNRPNSNNLGVNWSQANGGFAVDLRVNASQAFVNATNDGGQAIWNASSFGATQAAAFTFASLASQRNNAALILKATLGTTTSPARYVRVLYQTASGGRVVVQTTTNGSTFTTRGTLDNANSNFPNGSTLTARILNSGVVQVWKTTGSGTVYVGNVTLPADPAWTTGGGRIGMKFGTVGARVDNFRGN